MSAFNYIQEFDAKDLDKIVYPAYVIIEQDGYPKTVKVKLSEFKKWIIKDLATTVDNLDALHRVYN